VTGRGRARPDSLFHVERGGTVGSVPPLTQRCAPGRRDPTWALGTLPTKTRPSPCVTCTAPVESRSIARTPAGGVWATELGGVVEVPPEFCREHLAAAVTCCSGSRRYGQRLFSVLRCPRPPLVAGRPGARHSPYTDRARRARRPPHASPRTPIALGERAAPPHATPRTPIALGDRAAPPAPGRPACAGPLARPPSPATPRPPDPRATGRAPRIPRSRRRPGAAPTPGSVSPEVRGHRSAPPDSRPPDLPLLLHCSRVGVPDAEAQA
jgi:hypothetical protein